MEVHFFGSARPFLRHSDPVPEVVSASFMLPLHTSYFFFFPCKYLILTQLLLSHGALVGFLTCHVESLLAQLAGRRRGGHYGCVHVCHLQYSLIYFVDLKSPFGTQNTHSVFSAYFCTFLNPRFVRTSWNSTLTMSKQIFHSKSSSGPKETFPSSLHYSLCDTSTLVWHATDRAASVFWSQKFLFCFFFILLLIRFRSPA